ncbi:MAG: phage late control D family protein, partial [Treponema sp.]|nr:phage late control D family protein [Treponema sp.]
MAESGTMALTLKISGGGYDDLFPYELVLEEGFSLVYRAELTVLSASLHPHGDLKDLLDRTVSLGISQRISGGLVERNRYLHGIITGIVSSGLVSEGGKTNCYRYIITIESELARLRHTRFSHPYYRKTPPDIIEEILAGYQIRGQFADSLVNRGSYSKNLKFDQVNSSDLDFIYYLMELYGLSWTFAHGPPSKNGLGSAELRFTEGSRFPPPVYEYSDKRKVPEIEHFDFVNYDEKQGLWKLDGWRMESGIGVDGLEITAAYPETNFGSREWRWGDDQPGKRYHSYASLFHGYERRTPAGEIDDDIKKIIGVRRLSFL